MTHQLLTATEDQVDTAIAEAATLVVVRMRAKPAAEGSVIAELAGALERIRRGVPECLEILGYRDPLDHGAFLLYERWRTLAEFRAYLTRDDMIAYLARLDGLLESREITVWHEFGSEDD